MAELDKSAKNASLQRSIFHWIGYDDPFKEKNANKESAPLHKLISAEEVVKKHGIPRIELQKYIESEMRETENFASLPFTIFFVIAYACMVILHDDAVVIRAVEDSITFDVFDNANFAFDSLFMGHKNIHDVNSHSDFWSWLIQGFLPLMFIQESVWSEGRNLTDPTILDRTIVYTEEERGVLLHYNRIIGGIRFSQERSGGISCNAPFSLTAFYHQQCVGTAYELDPESWPARHTEADPEWTRWFYVRENYTDLEQRAMLLETQQPYWLDRLTQKIEIAVPVYNAEFGLHSLVFFNFYFSRGGHIWKQMIPMSTYANWFTKWYYAILDAIFYLCLLHIFRGELQEFAWIVRNKGWAALWSQYCTLWHVVDWVSVLGGFVIVLLSLLSFNGTGKVNAEAQKLAGINWMDGPTEAQMYNDQVEVYVDALEDVVKYVHNLKLVFAAYPLLIVFRLFKAFAAQPRLALVTNTLVVTGVDLLHFMLVFTSIFVTLAISGLVLFGRRLEHFTTFPRAVNTVFRLMLGDFDWEALRQVSMVEGACWLVITITIMNLLLLNMVLAIVMDGYSEVKRSSANSDTLLMELGQIWTRWWGARRGNLVPLRAINEALLALDREFTLRSSHAGRHHGRSVADTGDAVLLGKDTKPAVGQRVIPVDPDIAKFVGDGHIIQVAGTLLLCRVEHHDGTVREYNIGHDFNYELQLADGEPVIEIDEEEEQAQSLQLLSPERLMKVVNGYGTMSHQQAISLLTDAVMHYYKDHCEDVDMDSVRMMIRKVKFRTRKVKALILEGAGQTLSLNAAREMGLLRRYLADFYKAVDEDRRRSHEAIRIAKKDVEELSARLMKINPQELENMAKSEGAIGGQLPLPDLQDQDEPEKEAEEANELEDNVPALEDQKRRSFDEDDEDLDDAALIAEIDELLGESAAMGIHSGSAAHNGKPSTMVSVASRRSRHTVHHDDGIPDLSSEGTFDQRSELDDVSSLGFSDVGSIPDLDIGKKRSRHGRSSSSHRGSRRDSRGERGRSSGSRRDGSGNYRPPPRTRSDDEDLVNFTI
mmetsp:Transcript_10858/g.24910  ORF Transcript_10858/g.24910 Transcript_10858/m.24910 type:complete len:1047 (-) Transcript_10858:32-3172(-)